jgi:hypothetical protein
MSELNRRVINDCVVFQPKFRQHTSTRRLMFA